MKFAIKSQTKIVSSCLLPAHGKGGARATININNNSPSAKKISGRSPSRRAKRKGGLGEMNFCPSVVSQSGTGGGERFRNSALAEYQNRKIFVSLIEKIFANGRLKNVEKIFLFCSPSGERKRWAGFLPVRAEILVQNRFVLRSVIATKCNFYQFFGKMFACSPRLQLGSLRKFPYILGLNQMDGQNQKLFFYQADGGSACEARNKIEFCFQFFLFHLWRNTKPVFKI